MPMSMSVIFPVIGLGRARYDISANAVALAVWGVYLDTYSFELAHLFFNKLYSISSDFSHLPDMTVEYIDLSFFYTPGGDQVGGGGGVSAP